MQLQGRVFDPISVHLRSLIGQDFSLQNVPAHSAVMGTWCTNLIRAVMWQHWNDHILPKGGLWLKECVLNIRGEM